MCTVSVLAEHKVRIRDKNISDFLRNIGFSRDFHKEEIIHFAQLKNQDVPKFISNSEKKTPLQNKSPKSTENAICTPISTRANTEIPM